MKNNKSLLKKLFLAALMALTIHVELLAAKKTSTLAGGMWNVGTTWQGGSVPASLDSVIVIGPVTIETMAYNSSRSCRYLKIDGAAAILTILNGGGLTVIVSFTIDLVNGGSIEMYSTSALDSKLKYTTLNIGSGCNMKYHRAMSTTSGGTRIFHLISPPITANTVSAYLSGSWGAQIEKNNTNTLYALAKYNENQNKWEYFKTDGTNMAGESLTPGIGYTVAINGTSDNLLFDGAFNNSDITVSLQRSTGPTPPTGGWGWNALGNPFPAPMTLNSSTGFFKDNASQLDPLYGGIYVWDPATSSYSVITASTTTTLAVAQGFLVRSKAGGGTVSIKKSYMALSTYGFKSASLTDAGSGDLPTIVLTASSGNLVRHTDFHFGDNMTTGMDPYCDAGYLASGGGMELYSKMVNGPTDNFAVQALPNGVQNDLVLPIQLDLQTGGIVEFSGLVTDLPNGTKVLLEDRTLGTSTDLTQDNYKVTLPGNLTGLQRFYLHISTNGAAILPPAPVSTEGVITSEGTNIHVTGSFAAESKAVVFSLTGQNMGTFTLNENGTTIVNTNLSSGIYIVKIMQPNKKPQSGKVLIRE